MVQPYSSASMILASAQTFQMRADAHGTAAQADRVEVAAARKAKLTGAQKTDLMFTPVSGRKGNEEIVERFLQKALGMAKALARLQGRPVQAVMADLPQGLSGHMSGGWSYHAEVEVYANGAVRTSEGLTGTNGDDTLVLSTGDASEAEQSGNGRLPGGIDSGAGNDSLTLSSQRVTNVDGGAGRDRIAIDGMLVRNVRGGDGADAVAVVASDASNLDAGGGDDALSVGAHSVWNVDGGGGRDSVTIRGGSVLNVDGGDGSDVVHVVADSALNVDGGAGDDVIRVEGGSALNVSGGAGDDVIAVDVTGSTTISGGAGDDRIIVAADMALVRFEPGGGRDVVSVERAGHLTLDLGGATLDSIEIALDDDRVTLTHADGSSLVATGIDKVAELHIRGADGVAILREAPRLDISV